MNHSWIKVPSAPYLFFLLERDNHGYLPFFFHLGIDSNGGHSGSFIFSVRFFSWQSHSKFLFSLPSFPLYVQPILVSGVLFHQIGPLATRHHRSSSNLLLCAPALLHEIRTFARDEPSNAKRLLHPVCRELLENITAHFRFNRIYKREDGRHYIRNEVNELDESNVVNQTTLCESTINN